MHTSLMMDDVMFEALPWLLWGLGFAIMYVLADCIDTAKENCDA